MSEQLEEIKKIHDQANSLYPSNNHEDVSKAEELVMQLFGDEHTDWLIEQTEKFEKLEKAYFDDGFTPGEFMSICRKVFEG